MKARTRVLAPICSAAALGFAGALSLAGALGCRKAEAPTPNPPAPSLRLYVLSTTAGALEPCGCRKDMLGGVTHAAALIADNHARAPQHLVLGAGPLLFQDPELDRGRGDQDLWKAEALADSFANLGLAAWAPGNNDFAAGATRLAELVARSHAKLLGANLSAAGADAGTAFPLTATASYEVGGYRVGVAGIASAPATFAAPGDPSVALAAAERALVASGAQIRVALIAAPRGDALRLVEKVPGFAVALLGKPSESGDANDAPPPPTLIGDTLVVETSNHLQTLGYVDLFVKENDFAFHDGMDLEQSERRESLQRRIVDLDQRLNRWRSQAVAPSDQIAAGQQQRAALESELSRLSATKTTQNAGGSFFRYEVSDVRESVGSDPGVANVTAAYYRRVNTHNREAFRDRLPVPAPAGTSHYLGEAACASCHAEADAFWKTMQHAHAYQTLASQFKEFNLDCVGCHVTGYNRPGGSTVAHVDGLEDVQCEACHGPGSRHVEQGGDTGLIQRKPDLSVCRSCHRAPHVADDWNAEQAMKLILGSGHGLPVAPAAH